MQFVQFIQNKIKGSTRMQSIQASSTLKQGFQGHHKTKRSSKICGALKTRFLQLLQEQGATIKYAAKHLGINYSTAKVIAKENKHLLKENNTCHSDFQEQYLPFRQRKLQPIKKEVLHCSYREIENQENSSFIGKKDIKLIQVISTVAWNFLQQGIVSRLQNQKKKN